MRALFVFLVILAFQVLVTAALRSLATWLGRAREVAVLAGESLRRPATS